MIIQIKSLSYTILVLLFPNFIFGQQYLPYIAENKYWFYTTHSGADANPRNVSEFVHFFKGDTIISQIQYKKLYRASLTGKHDCQFPPCFTPNIPYETESPIEIGFVREEIISKKVFYISKQQSSELCASLEYELYDFDLLVGDSISECHRKQIGPSLFPSIGKIDSIKTEIIHGRERTVHYFTGVYNIGLPFSFPMKLIEGVGFNYYDPINYTQNTFYTSFCEGTLEQCNFLNKVSKINFNSTFSLHPNPSQDKIRIESDITIAFIEIYDLYGKSIIATNQSEIDISNLSSGIYFVNVNLKNGQVKTKKVIKH